MINIIQLLNWFKWMRQIFSEKASYLNQIDAAVGDGDHGYTMERAFTNVDQALQGSFTSIGQIFDVAAQVLAETSGGAIGPILAAFFSEGGTLFHVKTEIDSQDLLDFMQNGMEAVEQVGGAQPGDKTIIDAFVVTINSLKGITDQPILQALSVAHQAAQQGAEATRSLVATRGRARFLGERSLGYPDAGATSFVLMIEALERAVKNDIPEIMEKENTSTLSPVSGKFINDPAHMVDEDNEGLALAFPELVQCTADHILVRSTPKSIGKVGIAIGHGGGHTPSMGGFIGEGLLDSDVYGPIFTCASGVRIAKAIQLANHGAGVILLVSNHSGDVLNARLAIRRVYQAGIQTKLVLSSDDIATAPRSAYLDRRGLGGILFPLKIGGAAAEEGLNLDEVATLIQKANQRTVSLGISARAPTHPITGELLFDLPHGELEIGTGVHGELGVYRGPQMTADAVIDLVLERLLEDLGPLAEGRVAAFLNGSGGTSKMELHILYRRLCSALAKRDIKLDAGIVDSLFTTQEMGGFSLTLIDLDNELRNWFIRPAKGAYFRWPY